MSHIFWLGIREFSLAGLFAFSVPINSISILFPGPYSTSGIVALCFYLTYSPSCFCPLAHDASIPPPSACSLIRLYCPSALSSCPRPPPPAHSLISIRLTNNFRRSCFICQHLSAYISSDVRNHYQLTPKSFSFLCTFRSNINIFCKTLTNQNICQV